MKIVLLTGGSGFIGRNIVEQLGYKYTILAPTHEQLNLLNEDAVKNYLTTKQIDIIVHAAGLYKHPFVLEANLRMFANLQKHSDCKFIYFGSGAENRDGKMPVDLYGFSKYLISKIMRDRTYNLRLYGVFGKHEGDERFIPTAFRQGRIDIFDDILFEYVYINDLVRIVEWFIENSPPHNEYDICTGEPNKLSEIAHMIPVSYNIHQNTGKEYIGSNKRLLKTIPGFTFAKIYQALQEYYGYYKLASKV